MPPGKRALLASLAAVLSAPVIAWMAAEGVVYYEMFVTETKSRSELGEDLGLGILLFMVVPPVTLAGLVAVWFAVWRWLNPPVPSRHAKALN